jgi:hypothetical protein
MVEETEKSLERRKPSAWSGFWVVSLFLFGSYILRAMGVYAPVAWVAWGTVVNLIGYWLPPRPKVSFTKWLVTMELIIVVGVISLWFIPRFLRELMPVTLAYGLPLLLIGVSLYFTPNLYNDRKRGSLLMWVVGSCVFALLFGLLMSVVPEGKN